MRAATSPPRITSATRAGVTALVAAHRYRVPLVREIPLRGAEVGHRTVTRDRIAQPAQAQARSLSPRRP